MQLAGVNIGDITVRRSAVDINTNQQTFNFQIFLDDFFNISNQVTTVRCTVEPRPNWHNSRHQGNNILL